MSNNAFAFTSLLLTGGWLMAQTAAPATTVVYSQPSASDFYTAAHPGATFVKADSNGLTFGNGDGHYTFFTAPGIVHQQNGQWLPAQLQLAQFSDGRGWQLQGTAMNVAFTGATQDKDMVVSSGAVAFSLHLPSFSYNGDDTFTFQENGTAWLLRVSRNSVDIEATVATRRGKKTHSFAFNPGSAAVAIDQNGSLNVGNAAMVSRAVVRGADGKLYGICSPWSTSGSAASFTCDDTALPSAAFPYVIDPSTTTWSFNSSFFSIPSSPVEYVGTGSTQYFAWTATANLAAVAPQGAIITSSTINASGLGGSTAWDSRWGRPGSIYTSSCNVYSTGSNSSQAWVTALTYWSGGATAGCILSVSGQSSLSGTVTWWQPSVSSPNTPSGPSSGATGASYTYSTGGSTATSGDTPQYMFNWGDGTNSGWLAAGTTSASHAWASPGTYQVTASAEDASYGVTSGSSSSKSVTVTPSPPTLTSVSPSSGVQNSSVAVTLTGTNFVSGATVSTNNSGIAVSGVAVVSATKITATFSIGASAALGAANVTVATSGGTSGAATFTVNPVPVTTITSYSNSSGATVVGLTIALDGWPNGGSACTTPCQITDGRSHSIQMPTPEAGPSGGAGTEAVFAGWSDGGANPHTISPGTNVTVNFTTYYQFTGNAVINGNSSGGGTVVAATLNAQGVAIPSSSPPSGCLTNSSGWLCPAGTSFWVTGQANPGFGFIALNNGYRQQGIVMNGPVTVTANFSNNVLTITTSQTPQIVAGGKPVTAHYSGGSTASDGTNYNGGYGSDGTTLGSFSCYSVIDQIQAAISNVSNVGGTISFDASFSTPGNTDYGVYDMACSCNYFECFIDVTVDVTPPPPASTVSLQVGGDPITLVPVQVIPITVTLSGPSAVVTLSVSPPSEASLDQTTLNMASNQTITVNLTPLAPSQSVDDVQITAAIQGVQMAAVSTTVLGLTPARQSMTQVSGTGSPPGGTFSNYVGYMSGNSSELPQMALAQGVSAQTNPTSVLLSNPLNACSGTPCPGAESQIELSYALPPANDFVLPPSVTAGPYVATFGTSCYYTTLQTDWGTPPSSCLSTTIPLLGGTFQGVAGTVATSQEPIPVPSWLPAGSYCEAFLATFELQGNAQLANGTLWLWSANNHQVSQLIGSDGTPVVAGQTVARDLNIIPAGGVLLDLNGIGTGLLANDTGGKIQGYRIDRYMGSGVAACSGANASNVVSIGGCHPGNYNCPSPSAANGQH